MDDTIDAVLAFTREEMSKRQAAKEVFSFEELAASPVRLLYTPGLTWRRGGKDASYL